MTDSLRRIEIGFDSGQVVALRFSDDELAGLRKALQKGGWHQLSTEEATVDLDLSKLVFVKVAGDDHKVGF